MQRYKLAILSLTISFLFSVSYVSSAHADGVLDFFKKKDTQQSSQKKKSQDSQPLFLKPKKGMTPSSQYKPETFSQYKNTANSVEGIPGSDMMKVSKEMEMESMNNHSEKVQEFSKALEDKIKSQSDELEAAFEKKVAQAKAEQEQRVKSGMESGQFDDVVVKYKNEITKLEGQKAENTSKATKTKIKTQQERDVHDPIRLFKDFR